MYEWDEAKRAANLAKHGVDFARVAEFDWPNAVISRQIIRGEPRFRTLGRIGSRVCVLIWTRREAAMRIISLRKANRREMVYYEQAHIPDG